MTVGAHPGPPPRVRAHGHPHAAVHPAAAALGFGKRIRVEGPESHYVKEGTPTMGGLLIVGRGHRHLLLPRARARRRDLRAARRRSRVGLLGASDDYLNARTGEGIRVRQKLLWQTVVAFVAAWQIQQTYDITAIAVPFVGAVSIDPAVYIVFAAFAIIATTNGVNITDGLDGLAGGTLIFAFVAYMIIALLNVPLAQPNLALLCALIIGALLGFLWFNVHPAQIFMGDSGALALGATLAVIALITGQILVLPLIGIIFVLETVSVILQIAYFKVTGGKRLFRMAPLHHHFELGGWDEEKITMRFWIVGVLAALLGVTFFLASLDRLAVTTMTTHAGPIDLDDLTLDAIRDGPLRDRPVAVLGLARSGIALARFLAEPGARVTVYDGRPAGELADAIAALERPAGPARARPGRRPGGGAGPTPRWSRPRRRSARLPDDRAAPARGASGARRARAGGDRPCRRRQRGRPVPAPVPGADHRRDRHEGQDDDRVADRGGPRGRPAPPVVLGGNIGIPLVERLPELTPDHRVVVELSELQLPTLSRGTDVAVYTNVTVGPPRPPRLARGVPAVKRRLAELVDPDGALVLNAEDPVVAAYAGARARRASILLPARPSRCPAGSASSTAGSSRTASSDCRSPAAGSPRPDRTAGSCPSASSPSRAPTTSRNALAAVAVGLAVRRRAATRSAAAAAAFTGVEHRLEPVAIIDGVRFVNDSQGTQPDAVIAALRAFEPPIVLIAGGRDKGVDLDGLAAGRRRAGRRRGPHRRERPGRSSRRFRAAGPGAHRAGRRPRRRPSGAPTRIARAALADAGPDGRPGDGAAQPGRGQLRHVRRLRRPRAGVQGGGRGPAPTSRRRRGGDR